MSLQPQPNYVVPEETARVAKAAFPHGALCTRIYDALGTIFQDADFVELFPPQGQPAEAPVRLALATILQFLEGLSDRAAADAVRSRVDWKYLLCLELTDPGFDHTVLSEFRPACSRPGPSNCSSTLCSPNFASRDGSRPAGRSGPIRRTCWPQSAP